MLKPLDRRLLPFVIACALLAAPLAYGAPGPRVASSAAIGGRLILGSDALEPQRDFLIAGQSEAFRLRASGSGVVSKARIYVDRGSTAATIVIGIYRNAHGQPGALLSTGSVSAPSGGSWVTVSLAPGRLVAGRRYWLTVLGEDGTLRFRDRRHGRCSSDEDAVASRNGLPALWRAGTVRAHARCPVSAYVLVGAGTPLRPRRLPVAIGSLPSPTALPGLVSSTVPSAPPRQAEEAPTLPPAPANTSLPVISGATTQGQVLSSTAGKWSGAPSAYSYQWQDCNSSGSGCADISEASASTYTLIASDVGHEIRVVVSASNAGGSTPATSAASAIVGTPAIALPANTALPVLSGTATQGQVLSTTNGSWTHSPTSYGYQWQDCDSSGKGCSNVSEASNSSYTLGSGDVGHTIRVVVSAINAGGETPANSTATAVVKALPPPPAPTNTSLPVISGIITQGQVLSASNGKWNGSPTSYAYQWQACNSSGAECSSLAGAIESSYTLLASNVGHTMRVIVSATNTGGSTPATSTQTAAVGAAAEGTPYPACTQTISSGANVASAVSSAAGGTVICLNSGSYGALALSAKPSSEVTLQAAPSAHVTTGKIDIDGSRLAVRGLWVTGEVVLDEGASYITIDHDDISEGGEGVVFETSDCTVPNAPSWAGCEPHAPITNVTISGNHIHNIGQPGTEDAIHLDNWRNVTVTGNEFDHIIESGNHTDCLQSVYGGSELTFSHNYEHDNDCQGIFLKDGDVTGVSFTENLFVRDNEPDEKGEHFYNLAQFWNVADLTIEHNTIWDGKGMVFVAEDAVVSPSATINYNLFSYFSISKPVGTPYSITEGHNIFSESPETLKTSSTDSVSSKPQFDNTATDDYRLASNPNGIGIDWSPAEEQYGPAS